MKTLTEYINERKLGEGWKDISNKDFEAMMLAFDEPSKYGIDGGKISKLWAKSRRTGKTVINYDRGWDVKPSTPDVVEFYDEIINKYNK